MQQIVYFSPLNLVFENFIHHMYKFVQDQRLSNCEKFILLQVFECICKIVQWTRYFDSH
jgi:hypothetical protein